jgi:CRP-like cAMP-binding protein
VDEAKKISKDFMRMPQKLKTDLTTYIDDLLLPVRTETGTIQKSELDLLCQNISGALFATINNEHLNQIFSENRAYEKGDIICRQGTSGQEMFFIKEGEVAVFLDDTCVATLGPGEIFGEISLFYNVKRSATIKGGGEGAAVGVLSRAGLARLFRGGQPYARELIYRLYHILPERLRNLNDKYKGAIRALHLILRGEEKALPSLDIEMEMKREKSDFVPTLSEDEARAMCQEIKAFDTGQVICAEGEKADGAYFILEGKVRAIASDEGIKDIVLGELGEGEMFGEMALVDEKPRSATVVAGSPAKMAFLGKKEFDKLMETRSDLAIRLMGFICLSIFRRILRLDKLYSDMHRRF